MAKIGLRNIEELVKYKKIDQKVERKLLYTFDIVKTRVEV